jgi:hypothetical protein
MYLFVCVCIHTSGGKGHQMSTEVQKKIPKSQLPPNFLYQMNIELTLERLVGSLKLQVSFAKEH